MQSESAAEGKMGIDKSRHLGFACGNISEDAVFDGRFNEHLPIVGCMMGRQFVQSIDLAFR